jgi:hypothetical protein
VHVTSNMPAQEEREQQKQRQIRGTEGRANDGHVEPLSALPSSRSVAQRAVPFHGTRFPFIRADRDARTRAQTQLRLRIASSGRLRNWRDQISGCKPTDFGVLFHSLSGRSWIAKTESRGETPSMSSRLTHSGTAA